MTVRNKYSIKNRPKNKAFHQSKAKIKGMVTGTGFGKTAMLVNEIYKYLLMDKFRYDVLVVLPTWKMLNEVFIPEFKKFFPSVIFKQTQYNKIIVNEKAVLKRQYGGSKIYFRTGKNYETIRGLNNIGLVILDEAALMNEEVFDIVLGRLHRPGVKNGILAFGTTPRGTLNWTERRVASAVSRDIFFERAASWENPDFSEEDVEFFRQIYSEGRFRQEIEGIAIESDKLVYSSFQPSKHITAIPRKFDRFVGGVDFGLFSVAVLLGILNDNYYLIDIIYGLNKTAEWLGNQISDRWRKYSSIYYCDPSGGERIQSIPNAAKADNSVEDGIDYISSLIEHDRFFVNENIDGEVLNTFIGEVTSYSRDEKGRIVKKDDHILDAIRYAIYSSRTTGIIIY